MTIRIKEIVIRKDFTSRPWAADIVFEDGKVWKSWQNNYRSLKSMTAHIDEFVPQVVPRVRA